MMQLDNTAHIYTHIYSQYERAVLLSQKNIICTCTLFARLKNILLVYVCVCGGGRTAVEYYLWEVNARITGLRVTVLQWCLKYEYNLQYNILDRKIQFFLFVCYLSSKNKYC